MNYSDQILENKTFNFIKQLMYNTAVAICIMLIGILILVYGFKFRLYNVESDSQAPYYYRGDMVVVKAQKEYKVGDIIKFDETPDDGLPTTHRLVYILIEEGTGKTYYICHGDANSDLDGSERDFKWEDDHEYVKQLVAEGYDTRIELKTKLGADIQTPTLSQIEGKVVADAKGVGALFTFIKEHSMLFITLVAGIWCVSSVVQNEIEMKRSLRLL